jgi:predicted DNA-binding transcriptional regulator AlpA
MRGHPISQHFPQQVVEVYPDYVTTNDAPAQPPLDAVAGLTIGELARRTGVNVATLRMWESRHGFPRARRLPSGHRRYDEAAVDQVARVVRRRDAGVRLDVAVSEVTAAPHVPVPSVFATLRLAQPTLLPHRLRKSTLLALTWAIEDECCAAAQRPWLFGAFQHERFSGRTPP